MAEDVFVIRAAQRHPVRADLAQADPMPPPHPREHRRGDPAPRVALERDDREALTEVEEVPPVEPLDPDEPTTSSSTMRPETPRLTTRRSWSVPTDTRFATASASSAAVFFTSHAYTAAERSSERPLTGGRSSRKSIFPDASLW